MLKKLVSYGLISVMSLGMLAACGTSDDDSAEPTVTRAATSNAPAVATATAEGESAAATAQAGGETAAEGEATTAADEGGDTAAAPAGGATELTVSAVDIAFEETELTGPADTEFTITVTNNGNAQHDFVIDELGIATKMLNPGESETVTINAPAGDYVYYCSVPGHRAAGMEGTLTLSADAGAAAPAGDEAAAATESTPAPAAGEDTAAEVAAASPAAADATPDEAGAAAPAGDQAAAGAPVELTVSAVDIAFEETELSGPADTEFTITVTNNGLAQHDFVIDELGVKSKMLNPGESETLTINAPAGEYTYYCSVPGHRPAGMEGTLTLSADAGAAAPSGDEPAAEASPAASPAATPAGDGAAAGGTELTVSAVDIAFEETELSGAANTDITITITNNGNAQHDFVIDELGIATKMLNPGESETVTVNAPAGEYIYYCSVPGHRPAGMEGTLIIQ